MEVLEFFQELREGFPFLFEYVINILVIFIVSLSCVYLVSRMFGILRKDRPKNILAFIVMIVLGWFLVYTKYEFSRPEGTDFWLFIFDIVLYVSGLVIFYTLIGFKRYSRMDTLLDKKFGKDKPQRKMKKGGKQR